MNLSATLLLAFGMSMDAFAVSISKGTTLQKPKFSEALRTGLIFGAIETLTPLTGWGLGIFATQFVLNWNQWIAFVLMLFLGRRRGTTLAPPQFLASGDNRLRNQPGRHGSWCRSGIFAG